MLNSLLRKAPHSLASNHLKKTFSMVKKGAIFSSNKPSLVYLHKNKEVSTFSNYKNIRYFSESDKDPKKDSNEDKDAKKKEKDSENDDVDEEKKEKSLWEDFTSFIYKKDKNSSGKSKKDEDKGGFFEGGPELNDNVKIGLILLLGGTVLLVVQTDSFREFVGDYKKIGYSE